MIVLFLLTLVNAIANNRTSVLEARIEVLGFPINIIDGLLVLSVLSGLLWRLLGSDDVFHVSRMPRAFVWCLAFFTLASVGGGFMTTLLDIRTYTKVNEFRNFVSMPAAMIAGYFSMTVPKRGGRLAYIYVVCGTLCSLMILLFFVGQSNTRGLNNINLLRAIDYVSSYAGIAAAFLLFTLICGVQFLPRFVTIGTLLFCFLGQMSTLNRSNWLAQLAGLATAAVVMPPGRRLAGVARLTLAVSVICLLLLGASVLFSRSTETDFVGKLSQKVQSLLPSSSEDEKPDEKAWASRLPGIERELQLWLRSPVLGEGFGVSELDARQTGIQSYRHNAWTSFLAEAGIFGFLANAVLLLGTVVMGARMVREGTDRYSILLGGLGAVAAVYSVVEGLTTMSINNLRGAVAIGVICGAVMRARAMQLEMKQQQWDAYAGHFPTDEQGYLMTPELAQAYGGAGESI